MSITNASSTQKLVTNAWIAFTGTAPSAANYAAHVAFVGTSGAAAYISFLSSHAKTIPAATLASNLLTNLGLSSVFTAAEALAYINSNLNNLGEAITRVSEATLNYVSDSTFSKNAEMLAAKAAYTATATTALTHSSNSANTSSAQAVTPAPVGPAAPDGATIILTTGVDVISPTATDSKFQSTDKADTINGVVSALSATKTLDTTDVLDGGAGSDTLNLIMSSSFAGMASAGSIKNIENINLTNSGTVVRTFDASGVSGVELYSIDAAKGLINLIDLDATVAVSLSNFSGSGAFSTAFATAADEVAGSADAMTFNIKNLGTVEDPATTAVEEKIVTVTLTDIETINVNASGDNVVGFAGTDLTALKVAGDGNVNVKSVATTTTSFDGSKSTGNITVDVSNATAITNVSTGSGDDSVTFNEANGPANAVLSGGLGNDKLVLNSNGGTVQYQMTGFQTLALNEITTAALTLSLSKTEDLNLVTTKSTVAQAVTLVNAGAADLTINSLGVTVDAGDISASHTGSTNVVYLADAASVKAKTVQAPLGDFTFSGSKELTVSVGAYIDNTGSVITAAEAVSLTVNVESGKSSAATPVELTEFGGTITVNKATSIVVNADGKVDSATITAAAAKNATITNKQSSMVLTLDAAALEELTINSAKAADISGSTLSGVQVADIVISDGAYAGAALAALSNLTISGSGVTSASGGTTASSASTEALGGDNAYNLSVTASGLKGGFTTGALNTGVGFDIDVDATAVTGAVVLGVIGGVTVGENVKITTVGTGGNVTLDAINGAGTIAITNSGKGTIGVGAVSGKVVTIDTSETVGNVTLANVTSTGALTLVNTGTGTFTQTGAISAGVTGKVDINLSGSLGAVSLGTIAGKDVVLDLSNTVGGAGAVGVITALTSVNYKMSELQANGTALATITAATASTGLTVNLTGGILNDSVIINDVVTTNSIIVSGDLQSVSTSDTILVDADASTAGTMTINISALANYNSAEIKVTGAAAAGTTQTIVGGIGNDTIVFETTDTLTVADTVTGGKGSNTLAIIDAAGADADFTNVTDIQTLVLSTASTVTLAALAQKAGITAVTTGAAGAYTITATAMTVDLTVNAATAATGIVTFKSGQGNDTITVGASTGADVFHFQLFSTNGKDTIIGFDTTEDHLNFDAAMTGVTDVVAVTGLAAGVFDANLVDNEVYVFADGATAFIINAGEEDEVAGELTITDYSNLAQVAAFLSEGATIHTVANSNDTVAGDEHIFVINDLVGDKTFVYHHKESGVGIDASAEAVIQAGELTLIGVVTEEGGVALVAGDVI